jgi:hypothetical protein
MPKESNNFSFMTSFIGLGLGQAPGKRVPIKNEQQKYTYTDCGIGKVEYRAEKDKLLPTPERYPFGPDGFNKRKVEHVNHLTVQPSGVTSVVGEERGYLSRTVVEDDSIKDRIDDVAYCSGKDKGYAGNETEGIILFDYTPKIPGYESNGHKTKDSQKQFAYYLNAESHSGVLGKVDIEPGRYLYALMQLKMGLNPYLKRLVKCKEQYDDDHRSPSCLPVHGLICLLSLV